MKGFFESFLTLPASPLCFAPHEAFDVVPPARDALSSQPWIADLIGSASKMTDAAQRISLVLEYFEEEAEWAVVAMLIDDRGSRRITTLARFSNRLEASELLESIFASLPIQMGKGA